MRKLFWLIIILAVIVILALIVLPSILIQYFWASPLQQKAQSQLNFQSLCQQWNATACSGNPSDELCKAAVGRIASQFVPLNTTKCSDISSDGITLLRRACCGTGWLIQMCLPLPAFLCSQNLTPKIYLLLIIKYKWPRILNTINMAPTTMALFPEISEDSKKPSPNPPIAWIILEKIICLLAYFKILYTKIISKLYINIKQIYVFVLLLQV
jgi:hypothetical protein